MQLNLDVNARATLMQKILVILEGATQGSTVELRGSLAEGRADAYSDIDMLWEVPDKRFQSSVESLPEILSKVHPLESLRSAPDFQNSDRRRLVFIQFEDIPLFWRVDLDIFAQSLHRDFKYDVDNPAARGENWSLTHSALMNAIAAVKALLRGREEEAEGLIARGFQRVGLPVPQGDSQRLILELAARIESMDSTKVGLVHKVVELHRWAFDPEQGGYPQ